MRPFEMDVAASVFAGDPLRFARRQRDLAVDRKRQLERDSRPSQAEPSQIARERFGCGLRPSADLNLDSRVAEPGNSLPARAPIGIPESDDHAGRLRLHEQVRASGPTLTFVRTGLERHIDCGTLRLPTRLRKRDRLGMRSDGRNFPKDRCLVPLDGFYEYTAPEDPKQKRKSCWLFRPAPGQEFAIAGLLRPHPQVGEGFTLLTAPPGPDVEPLHNRQIVLLRPDQWRPWLDGTAKSLDMAPSSSWKEAIVTRSRFASQLKLGLQL